MAKHSKSNNSSGVFTHAERKMTNYGTKSRRLGRESKRKFDACHLCLQPARTPMLCGQGHISCRECVMANILEQKHEIERANKRYAEYLERQKKEGERRVRERESQEVERYRRREVGLGDSMKEKRRLDVEAGDSKDEGKRARLLLEHQGTSARAVTALISPEDPGPSAPKQPLPKPAGKLSSFWVPSQAPSAESAVKPPASQSAQCFAARTPHALRLKSLIEVRFRAGSAPGAEKLCPACDRALLNSSQVDVLRPCGHAICHRCVGNFVLPAKECFVCQAKVAAKDVVRIDTEGTGFAGGGGQMVATRYEAALQV
ncbi:hypothetical protein IWW54_003937 [Coemansia sp. RSA 2705]|nr:hypothetical protein IWW54_003937 [Coemansia sp. RSA 2705]